MKKLARARANVVRREDAVVVADAGIGPGVRPVTVAEQAQGAMLPAERN